MASIKELTSGKWQARIRVKGIADESKSFATLRDAKAWTKITESEILRGVYMRQTVAQRMSLAEALVKYEKEVTPSKRGADQERYRIRSWKVEPLARKSLASLRGVDFASWRDKRLKDVKPATVRHDLEVISNLFNVARREWGMEGLVNPVEGIRLPTANNARSRVFYPGEEALLMAVLEPPARKASGQWGTGKENVLIKPFVLLALETAMRRGELLSLRWENVKLNDQIVYLPMTKNGQSRTVPLSKKAVEVLNGMTRKQYGSVFDGLTANAVKLGFIRAVKRARRAYVGEGGNDPRMLVDLRMHDLRHIAVTRLAERLPNIVELAAVSGHNDVRMLKRYYHPKAEILALKLG